MKYETNSNYNMSKGTKTFLAGILEPEMKALWRKALSVAEGFERHHRKTAKIKMSNVKDDNE